MQETAAELIERKGGAASFARAIGHEASAVRMMKHRNKLPRAAWPEILEAFPDVSIADLKAIESADHNDHPHENGAAA
jgi:hypothetical protein